MTAELLTLRNCVLCNTLYMKDIFISLMNIYVHRFWHNHTHNLRFWFYLTLAVVLLSGLQGSCAATAVDPWVNPDDPWPWVWPWESLLWEMDSFFFRGRPFRLGAEGKENSDNENIHLGGRACADAALFDSTMYVHSFVANIWWSLMISSSNYLHTMFENKRHMKTFVAKNAFALMGHGTEAMTRTFTIRERNFTGLLACS